MKAISDGGGGAIITWRDHRSGQFGDIYAQRIDEYGNQLWTPGGIPICTTAEDQKEPVIVADGKGGAIIAWNDMRDPTFSIYAQRIDSSGTRLWSPSGEHIFTGPWASVIKEIVSDGDQGAVFVLAIASGPNSQVIAQRITRRGEPGWGQAGVDMCPATNKQSTPALTATSDGFFIVTWTYYGAGYGIYAQKLNSSGDILWGGSGVTVCSNGLSGYRGASQVASAGSGGTIVTWMDSRNSGSGVYDIYAQKVNSEGDPIWTENGVSVCIKSNYQHDPMIVADDAGGAIVAWSEWAEGFGSSLFEEIFAQRLNGDGEKLWPPHYERICPASQWKRGSPLEHH
ncbi:MAG: hypothetical protein HY770_00350 [Chitinivibrionia bacterium]|nr:hypothetical protein [Chitinivibrionia bacterium]